MQRINTTRYEIQSEKIHKTYKVAVLADLHMKTEEWRIQQIVSILKAEKPKYVFVAGDLITTYPAAYAGVRGDFGWAIKMGEMFQKVSENCEVFYVDGNHEIYLKEALDNGYAPVYEQYHAKIQDAGVILLHNNSIRLNDEMLLYGHEFSYDYYQRRGRVHISAKDIEHVLGMPSKDLYTILLTHDPIKFDTFVEWGADLVVSGHMHGGVIRIGKKGIIGADRTVFPKYCYGEYAKNDSKMIITGGLGEHSIWKRVFNPPEIVFLTIGSKYT